MTQVTEDKLAAAGEKAAAFMEDLWKMDVFDPPIGSSHPRAKFCLDVIEGIIGRNGWSWALPYRGDGPPQWCGMTAGDAWYHAGLDPSWLSSYWASTIRLHTWAMYSRWDRKAKANPHPLGIASPAALKEGALRLLVDIRKSMPTDVTPQRGDIIIVGDGDPRWGDHVTVNMGARQVDGAWIFDTISGNGGGLGPRGDKRQGISRRDYRIGQAGYKPMWLIRPAISDLA